MNKTFWVQWLESFFDNLKSKPCPDDAEGSKIQIGCDPAERLKRERVHSRYVKKERLAKEIFKWPLARRT